MIGTKQASSPVATAKSCVSPPLDMLDSCVSQSECKRGKPVPIYPVDLGCDGEKVEWPSGRRNRGKHYPVAIAVCLGQTEKCDRQGKGEKLNSKIQDIYPRPLVVIQFPDSLMHPELRQMVEGRRRRNTLHTANQLHGKENFRLTKGKATTFFFFSFSFFNLRRYFLIEPVYWTSFFSPMRKAGTCTFVPIEALWHVYSGAQREGMIARTPW